MDIYIYGDYTSFLLQSFLHAVLEWVERVPKHRASQGYDVIPSEFEKTMSVLVHLVSSNWI